MKTYLIVLVLLFAGLGFPDCNFEPMQTFDYAVVIKVKLYDVPRKNKCFPDRGKILGKIRFRYEYPKGSGVWYEYLGYYDESTRCTAVGSDIPCWEVPEQFAIENVEYIEKDRGNRDKRGLLISLNVPFLGSKIE